MGRYFKRCPGESHCHPLLLTRVSSPSPDGPVESYAFCCTLRGTAWTDYLEQEDEHFVLRDLFIPSSFDRGSVLASFWANFSHCLRCDLGSVLFEGRIPCAGAYP